MTEDVKLDLYNAVETALLELEDFKHVLKYNSQDLHENDDKPKNYPQLHIYFPSIEWNPPMQQGHQQNLTNEQKGVIQIAVRVSMRSLGDNQVTFKPDFGLIAKVYRALALIDDDNINPLYRISETDDIDNNNVRRWEIIFQTQVTECGISKGEVDAAPVAITINKDFV